MNRFIPFLCLILTLYILTCLFHDITVHYITKKENSLRAKQLALNRQDSSQKLEKLLMLSHEENIMNNTTKRLENIKYNLNLNKLNH